MWKFWERKPVVEPEAKIFLAFEEYQGSKKEILRQLIWMYAKDCHLHHSPPKGVKRTPKVDI